MEKVMALDLRNYHRMILWIMSGIMVYLIMMGGRVVY
jgi:hypothetical protein